MGQERRSFGSIERRSGYFRARYMGPDRQRYEAPNLFSDRIEASRTTWTLWPATRGTAWPNEN
jgi:hypothetical protein